MNMFIPKKQKFRKAHVGVIRGLATGGSTLANGDYGLRVIESGDIKANQLESARVAARKATKRHGQIMFKVQASVPKSKKPLEVRMGKGKGPVAYHVAKVRAGRILFEMNGVSREVAYDAFKRASHKLPLKATFVERVSIPVATVVK